MLFVCRFRMYKPIYVEGTTALWRMNLDSTKARISSEVMISVSKRKLYEIIPGFFVSNHMNLSQIIIRFVSIYWFQSIPMHIRLIILTHFSPHRKSNSLHTPLQSAIFNYENLERDFTYTHYKVEMKTKLMKIITGRRWAMQQKTCQSNRFNQQQQKKQLLAFKQIPSTLGDADDSYVRAIYPIRSAIIKKKL